MLDKIFLTLAIKLPPWQFFQARLFKMRTRARALLFFHSDADKRVRKRHLLCAVVNAAIKHFDHRTSFIPFGKYRFETSVEGIMKSLHRHQHFRLYIGEKVRAFYVFLCLERVACIVSIELLCNYILIVIVCMQILINVQINCNRSQLGSCCENQKRFFPIRQFKGQI